MAVALALAVCAVPVGLSPPADAADDAPIAHQDRVGHPTDLATWVGDGSSATGSALAQGECDVDGDGFADVVVGAWFWDKAPLSNIGAAYVLFGNRSVEGADLNTTDLAGVRVARVDGPEADGASIGFSVGCFGDVNGDGFDDIGISRFSDQLVYVVFGSEGFTGLAIDYLGDRGFVVRGDESSGNVGYSMSGVGDLDGDGLDDLAVTEVAASYNGRSRSGRVWIVAGQKGLSDVDLVHPGEGQVIMTIDGAAPQERLGVSAMAGDVNGDGTGDLVLGSYVGTPWGAAVVASGAAYVVFGGARGAVDTAALGDDGFTVLGPQRQRDRLGVSVAAAGDVNGDGLADLLIGADGVSNAATGPRSGGAAVVFGSASTQPVYTAPDRHEAAVYACTGETATGTGECAAGEIVRGYWIAGEAAGDSAGYSVTGVGDVNADGIPDALVGGYGHDPVDPASGEPRPGAGAAWVVYGQATAATVELADLDPDAPGAAGRGYRLDGRRAGDRFGRQVAGVGDVDGNGHADMVIGGDLGTRNGLHQAGEVVVALMGARRVEVGLTADAAVVREGGTASLVAEVSPGVVRGEGFSGTVTFLRDGDPVAGCTGLDVEVAEGPAAVECTDAAVGTVGDHAYLARFDSRDALWASATSAEVAVRVLGGGSPVPEPEGPSADPSAPGTTTDPGVPGATTDPGATDPGATDPGATDPSATGTAPAQGTADRTGTPGGLAFTGANGVLAWIAAAVLLVGGGTLAVRRTLTRRASATTGDEDQA